MERELIKNLVFFLVFGGLVIAGTYNLVDALMFNPIFAEFRTWIAPYIPVLNTPLMLFCFAGAIWVIANPSEVKK